MMDETIIPKEKMEIAAASIYEKCSRCGKEIFEGSGRFRTPDYVYCTSCYYERHLVQHTEDGEKAE